MHGAYILVIVFFVVLSQIKAAEAEKQAVQAQELATKAEMAAEDARKSAAEAFRQQDIANQYKTQLENCKSGE